MLKQREARAAAEAEDQRLAAEAVFPNTASAKQPAPAPAQPPAPPPAQSPASKTATYRVVQSDNERNPLLTDAQNERRAGVTVALENAIASIRTVSYDILSAGHMHIEKVCGAVPLHASGLRGKRAMGYLHLVKRPDDDDDADSELLDDADDDNDEDDATGAGGAANAQSSDTPGAPKSKRVRQDANAAGAADTADDDEQSTRVKDVSSYFGVQLLLPLYNGILAACDRDPMNLQEGRLDTFPPSTVNRELFSESPGSHTPAEATAHLLSQLDAAEKAAATAAESRRAPSASAQKAVTEARKKLATGDYHGAVTILDKAGAMPRPQPGGASFSAAGVPLNATVEMVVHDFNAHSGFQPSPGIVAKIAAAATLSQGYVTAANEEGAELKKTCLAYLERPGATAEDAAALRQLKSREWKVDKCVLPYGEGSRDLLKTIVRDYHVSLASTTRNAIRAAWRYQLYWLVDAVTVSFLLACKAADVKVPTALISLLPEHVDRRREHGLEPQVQAYQALIERIYASVPPEAGKVKSLAHSRAVLLQLNRQVLARRAAATAALRAAMDAAQGEQLGLLQRQLDAVTDTLNQLPPLPSLFPTSDMTVHAAHFPWATLHQLDRCINPQPDLGHARGALSPYARGLCRVFKLEEIVETGHRDSRHELLARISTPAVASEAVTRAHKEEYVIAAVSRFPNLGLSLEKTPKPPGPPLSPEAAAALAADAAAEERRLRSYDGIYFPDYTIWELATLLEHEIFAPGPGTTVRNRDLALRAQDELLLAAGINPYSPGLLRDTKLMRVLLKTGNVCPQEHRSAYHRLVVLTLQERLNLVADPGHKAWMEFVDIAQCHINWWAELLTLLQVDQQRAATAAGEPVPARPRTGTVTPDAGTGGHVPGPRAGPATQRPGGQPT